MKILHTVQSYYPSVGGMAEVVKQLSERLVLMGHDVTVATSTASGRVQKVINGVVIEAFDAGGNLAQGLTGEVERYREFVIDGGFEIVTNFAAQQWATDALITILDKISAKKVFVPTGFSGLYLERFNEYFVSMRRWLLQYDMNVFLSEDYRDVNFAREWGVKKILVIPNGASEDEFVTHSTIDIRGRLGIPSDHFLILMVGSHTGLKGHGAALEIFSRAKLTNATLLIIANSFGRGCTYSCRARAMLFSLSGENRRSGKRLIMTSLPRVETVAAYQAADLFLFPSNVECSPLVLFECMASHTPFLTTDVGNAGEIIQWSGSGALLPTHKDQKGYSRADIAGSTIQLTELYHNSPAREEMSERGFRAWQERFNWGTIARQYEELYQALLGGS